MNVLEEMHADCGRSCCRSDNDNEYDNLAGYYYLFGDIDSDSVCVFKISDLSAGEAFEGFCESWKVVQAWVIIVPERVFVGFLVLDWRSGAMTVKRRKPKKIGGFQIPIKIELKVATPEQKEMVMKGDITLTQSKVNEMFLESL